MPLYYKSCSNKISQCVRGEDCKPHNFGDEKNERYNRPRVVENFRQTKENYNDDNTNITSN